MDAGTFNWMRAMVSFALAGRHSRDRFSASFGQFDSGARLACNSHPIIPAIPVEIEVAA